MEDDKDSWKRFRRISFDSKKFSKRAKRAETSTTRHAHKFVVSKLESLRSVKQHIIIWLLIIGILIGAVALQMVWYQQAYRTVSWAEGGTYAEAVQGPINTLNPLYATTNAELSAGKLIFSSLLDYDNTGHLSNDLAESIAMENKGRTYNLVLRDDAFWSDGTKVTAQDVVFTVGLMKSEEARSVMVGNWTDVTAQVLDDRTVSFILPASYASFPHALTFAVLPKHILESVAPGALRQNTFSVAPIGSGPFDVRLLQVSSDVNHKIVHFSASKSYYGGHAKLARFELHAYRSTDDIVRAVQTGEVNAAADISTTASVPQTYTTKQYPVNSGVYALFNTTDGVLSDTKVRQALQVATDTAAIRKHVDSDLPELYLPFVSNQLQGSGIPAKPSYSVARAQKLLTAAGWKLPKTGTVRQNKAKKPLELKVVTVKDSVYEKVVQQLSAQWRPLGVDVKVEIRDPESASQDFVQTTLQPRNYDVLLYELVIGADPDVYAYWHSSQATSLGYNFANYKSNISDDILTSARSVNDPLLRNEKYKTFAKQWLKDAPAIGVYQSVMRYVYRPSVNPVIDSDTLPSAADRYSDVLYWSAQQELVYKTP